MTGGPLTVGEGPLRVLVDPDHGGRLLSVRGDGREWLTPSSADDLTRTPGPGTPFVRSGMGGWDEVIPSVAATTLPDGRRLADHGEAWRRPWDLEAQSADAVTMSVRLDSLPLVLRRTLRVVDRRLQLDYEVEADHAAAGPTPALWSAHPQFAAHTGTRVILDHGVTVHVQHPAGAPDFVFSDGDVLADLPTGSAIKAFVRSPGRVDRALVAHADGAVLSLTWDSRSLPYLGLWWDNGFCSETRVIAVEPCTGFGDDAATAAATGRVLMLAPGERSSWWLRVDVTSGAQRPISAGTIHEEVG